MVSLIPGYLKRRPHPERSGGPLAWEVVADWILGATPAGHRSGRSSRGSDGARFVWLPPRRKGSVGGDSVLVIQDLAQPRLGRVHVHKRGSLCEQLVAGLQGGQDRLMFVDGC